MIVPRPPTVLVVAGSDSGGCSGIQADIRALYRNGVHVACVVSAITAQHTQGVLGVYPVEAKILHAQFQSVFDDFDVRAIKTGLLPTVETVDVLCEVLQTRTNIPLIVDPVLVSTTGSELMNSDVPNAILNRLLPFASLITPNIPEAIRLSGINIWNQSDIIAAAKRIQNFAPNVHVLIKGGHSPNLHDSNTCADYFHGPSGGIWIEGPYWNGRKARGLGCTLASTIAARIALGNSIENSVRFAKSYVYQCLTRTLESPGKGIGPIGVPF